MTALVERRRGTWFHRLVPVVLLLLGMVTVLYPVAATVYNDYHQRAFARRYAQQTASAPAADQAEALAAAEAYNAALSPTLLHDPWGGEQPQVTPQYQEYLGLLSRFDAMARLRIDAIDVDLPVFHGTTDEALDRGLGHMYGTDLPVGGEDTHTALTGHTGLTQATMLDRLTEVKVGDRILIDIYGRNLAYQVDDIQVVKPDDLTRLARVEGADRLTLVTCTPYGVNSHRLLVHAGRVAHPDASGPSEPGLRIGLERWMYPRLGIAAGAAALLLWMCVGWIRRDRRDRRARRIARAGKETR